MPADYIGNWIKMLMGAKQVDPSGQMPPQDTQAASAAPAMPTNPMTGAPRAANYGQDVTLPNMQGPVGAMIEHLKSIGYPEAMAVRAALDHQRNNGMGGVGAMASKIRSEQSR